jgi:hypothetical protein
MATNPSCFIDFLTNIRPSDAQRGALKDGHTLLRSRLREYEPLKKWLVSDFLQGSYRRATALRPTGKKRSDVDIVVVTRLGELEWSPAQALALFAEFARAHYPGKYQIQGRSIGITMSNIEMDLVVTSAPSEVLLGALKSEALDSDDDLDEAPDLRLNAKYVRVAKRGQFDAIGLTEAAATPEWKTAALRIPDRDARCWEDTNPLAQLQWTRDKNARCERHFVNVVKALKWLRYDQHAVEHPKSYPLERVLGEYCPDGIESVAQGVTETLEAIVRAGRAKPVLTDYGTGADVLKRVEPDEYARFYEQAVDAAPRARKALDERDRAASIALWHEFFGDKFPAPPAKIIDGGGGTGGFSPRVTGPSTPTGGRFA